MNSFNMWNPSRAYAFWARFYMYLGLFQRHFRIPFNIVRPGLEIKYACEESTKLGAKTYFLGAEFNQDTWQRLYHETRYTLIGYLYKLCQYSGYWHWARERAEVIARLQNSEPAQFSEQCVDPYLVNWFIQSMDIYFPHLKRIFVD